MGLRAAEVASLQLDDVDWRAGELVVHGKGGRIERLPMPVDVGEALVAYLTHARPRVEVRALIVSLQAPFRPLRSTGIGQTVWRACVRAGVPPVRNGIGSLDDEPIRKLAENLLEGGPAAFNARHHLCGF